MLIQSLPEPATAMSRVRSGDCVIDFRRDRVVRDWQAVALSHRAAGVLRHLILNAGQDITRDRLISTVWSGMLPTDDVLSHAIREIRQAMGDSARNSRYIQTLPRIGYRYVAELEQLPARRSWRTTAIYDRIRWPLTAAVLVAALMGIAGDAGLQSPPVTGYPVNGAAVTTGFSHYLDYRPLAVSQADELYPSVSPDAGHVAFSKWNHHTGTHDLAIQAVGAVQADFVMQTPLGDEYSPAWSPDQQRLAYIAQQDQRCTVRIIDLHSGVSSDVIECLNGGVTSIDWSPDGSQLVMSNADQSVSPQIGLYLVDINSRQARRLTYPCSADGHDFFPRFSPDGNRLSFVRGNGMMFQLGVLSLDAPEAVTILRSSTMIDGQDWIQNGNYILFCDYRTANGELHRLDPVTGEDRILAHQCLQQLSASHSGDLIAYQRTRLDLDLVDIPLGESAASAPPGRFSTTGQEQLPLMNADSSLFAFVTDRSGAMNIHVGISGSQRVKAVTRHADGEISNLLWSEQDNSIYYLHHINQAGALYRTSVNAASGTRLSPPGMDISAVTLAARPGQLYVSVLDHGSGDIRLFDTHAPEESGQVVINDRVALKMHYDAHRDRLYFMDNSKFLIHYSQPGGDTVTASDWPVTYYNRYAWTIDGSSLYALLSDGNSNRLLLARYSLDTGKLLTETPMPGNISGSLPFIINGDSGVFNAVTAHQADIVISGLNGVAAQARNHYLTLTDY